jgi:predicted DNA-binding transcriptional regulator AlpA
MDEDERLLTIAEVRQRLGGISHSRFYTLARELDLPLYKLGRLTRVRQRDLAAAVARLPKIGQGTRSPGDADGPGERG